MYTRVWDSSAAQGATKSFFNTIGGAVLAFVGGVVGDVPPGSVPEAVAVRNPSQLQVAVRSGVTHIVIAEHLDMTTTPRFFETTVLDAGMLAIVPNEDGQYTRTIRGNCSGPPPELNLTPPLDERNGQCVVQVREDFLEQHLQHSVLFIANLYITVPGVEKNHTTLIGVHGGDIYMTGMTFVGDGDRARAIDVKENRRVYVGLSRFSNFSTDKDGVIRLEPGARATISQTRFYNSEVATDKPNTVAAGPVMGLYAGLAKQAAAAWFQDCEFAAFISTVPGEVAVENRDCRVYSNTLLPTVWDLDLGRQVGAWTLTLDDPDGTMGLPNAFADVETGLSSRFLRPTDDAFQSIYNTQAISTRIGEVFLAFLPEGTEYRTSDPYASMSDGATTSPAIGLIAGISIGSVLCVLAALLAGWCICSRKRSNADDGVKLPAPAQVSSLVPTSSSIPSALATNSHWATEITATFKGTMCNPDVPPPDADAPATKKLDFLHAQLNGIPKNAVILERFTLLGPSQRRQGGQGVVAFARGVHSDLGYALKFFVERSSFLAERDMYRSTTLGRLLPQVQAEYDPEETPTALMDRLGRPLPPCIAMERGESLPDWSKRAKPDVFHSVAVLANVATRLRDMHDAGYVHRDIKPENVMFLPRENRWTVIDFGCAAHAWKTAPLAYTLVYSPPEVAEAVDAGARTIGVTPAMDAWALGVVAFELLTGQSAFNLVIEGRDSVVAKLLGKEELAWEGDLAEKNSTARRRLGLFREPILSLLHRDPAQRASLADFCKTTNNVFSSPTTVEMP